MLSSRVIPYFVAKSDGIMRITFLFSNSGNFFFGGRGGGIGAYRKPRFYYSPNINHKNSNTMITKFSFSGFFICNFFNRPVSGHLKTMERTRIQRKLQRETICYYSCENYCSPRISPHRCLINKYQSMCNLPIFKQSC